RCRRNHRGTSWMLRLCPCARVLAIRKSLRCNRTSHVRRRPGFPRVFHGFVALFGASREAPRVHAKLFPHPSTPAPRVRALRAEVAREADGALAIAFALDADLDALALGAPAAPRFVLGLWERTCFEAFVAIDGVAGYLEWNATPSREWALLELRA